MRIRFVDPELHPDQARAAGVELAGELVLEYRDRRESLRTLSEGHISNALQRLIGRPERWIGTLTGHGERSLSGKANHDLGDFGTALEQRGYRIQPLDLAETAAIPDNLGLLVLAGPRVDLLPGEVQRLRNYLAAGGNLLWLLDPDGLFGLEALAGDLGIEPLPGHIVDANVRELGVDDPSVALVSRYPDHAATRGFELMSLFPMAAALESTSTGAWRATPLLSTLPRSWNETGPIQGQVRRDEEQGERAGPLALGIALERQFTHPSGGAGATRPGGGGRGFPRQRLPGQRRQPGAGAAPPALAADGGAAAGDSASGGPGPGAAHHPQPGLGAGCGQPGGRAPGVPGHRSADPPAQESGVILETAVDRYVQCSSH